MNQDYHSCPPIPTPSTELGALLFAALPCLQESYRPLASFAFHFMELSKLKAIPSIPKPSTVDALFTDKDVMLRSLSFYGNLFRMPLLSMLANLLQGMQFYKAYKDVLPGLFSAMGGTAGSPADSLSGLFSGFSGSSPDLFSALGGLSPDLLSSLLSGLSRSSGTPQQNETTSFKADTVPPETASQEDAPNDSQNDCPVTSPGGAPEDSPPNSQDASQAGVPEGSPPNSPGASQADAPEGSQEDAPVNFPPNSQDAFQAGVPEGSQEDAPVNSQAGSPEDSLQTAAAPSQALYDSLYSFLTPEQQKIYEQLMHTD